MVRFTDLFVVFEKMTIKFIVFKTSHTTQFSECRSCLNLIYGECRNLNVIFTSVVKLFIYNLSKNFLLS